MPTKEDHLKQYTHKEEGLELEKRVFYTLTGEPDKKPLSPEKLRDYRNSKAIALLFKVLHENGTLTEDQLDDILLEVAR
jgi:hypothetical protein